jgi:hypothetical protein
MPKSSGDIDFFNRPGAFVRSPTANASRIDRTNGEPSRSLAAIEHGADVQYILVDPARRRNLARNKAERVGHARQKRGTDMLCAMHQPIFVREPGVEQDAVQ